MIRWVYSVLAGFSNHVIKGHLHTEHSESNLRPVVSSVLWALGVVRVGSFCDR